jgi:PAS domain S-box-containing protein
MLVHHFIRDFLLPNPLLAAGVAAGLLSAIGLLYLVARSYSAPARRYDVRHEHSPAEKYFAYSSEAIVVTNRDEKIVDLNPRAESMFRFARGELFGQPIEMLIADRSHAFHASRRYNYLASPQMRSMGLDLDLVGRRNDGVEFPLHMRLSFVPGERGDLVVASMTDMGGRLATEREARRTELLAALGAVVAGVAHELNNPLSVICTRMELTRQQMGRLELPAQVRNDLRIIDHHAHRAGRIAYELLALARERPKERMRAVDVNDIVDRAMVLMADQMLKGGIRIDLVLERSLPPVLGDPVALEQVLINLLANARDAMPEGGAIRIETRAIAGRPGWLYLALTDTGCGVLPDHLSRLFELFYTTKTSGAGLGLWLSRRIVLEHRGTIEAHSRPGKGSTFMVSLPQIETGKPAAADSNAHIRA